MMSASGPTRTSRPSCRMSVSPPRADIQRPLLSARYQRLPLPPLSCSFVSTWSSEKLPVAHSRTWTSLLMLRTWHSLLRKLLFGPDSPDSLRGTRGYETPGLAGYVTVTQRIFRVHTVPNRITVPLTPARTQVQASHQRTGKSPPNGPDVSSSMLVHSLRALRHPPSSRSGPDRTSSFA